MLLLYGALHYIYPYLTITSTHTTDMIHWNERLLSHSWHTSFQHVNARQFGVMLTRKCLISGPSSHRYITFIFWRDGVLLNTFTARDYTLQTTDRLGLSATLLGNGFQRWTFTFLCVHNLSLASDTRFSLLTTAKLTWRIDAWWATEPVWTQWRRESYLTPAENITQIPPSSSKSLYRLSYLGSWILFHYSHGNQDCHDDY
jgi:hypothetical protein